MKRGIIRIFIGSILTLFQIVSTIYWYSSYYYYLYLPDFNNSVYSFAYYVGFYSAGIIGLILLFSGIRAYNKRLRSRLILHAKTRIIHKISRWFSFAAIIAIITIDSISILRNHYVFETTILIYTVLTFCSYLSFAIYLLFYIYKKPCCLFSTSLLFLGLSYLSSSILSFDTLFYLLIPFKNSNISIWESSMLLNFFVSIIVGILYIIIASKLYKETFSINTIKTLGWIAFVIDLFNMLLIPIMAYGYFHFYFKEILLITVFFLYTSIFKINTLKNKVTNETTDTIRFCRKCGNKLLEEAKFCNKCGTEVIEDIPSLTEETDT